MDCIGREREREHSVKFDVHDYCAPAVPNLQTRRERERDKILSPGEPKRLVWGALYCYRGLFAEREREREYFQDSVLTQERVNFIIPGSSSSSSMLAGFERERASDRKKLRASFHSFRLKLQSRIPYFRPDARANYRRPSNVKKGFKRNPIIAADGNKTDMLLQRRSLEARVGEESFIAQNA